MKLITSDLPLAAVVSMEVPITSHEMKGKQVVFIFDDERATYIKERYMLGQCSVEPQRFFNQIKTLKNLCS